MCYRKARFWFWTRVLKNGSTGSGSAVRRFCLPAQFLHHPKYFSHLYFRGGGDLIGLFIGEQRMAQEMEKLMHT